MCKKMDKKYEQILLDYDGTKSLKEVCQEHKVKYMDFVVRTKHPVFKHNFLANDKTPLSALNGFGQISHQALRCKNRGAQ